MMIFSATVTLLLLKCISANDYAAGVDSRESPDPSLSDERYSGSRSPSSYDDETPTEGTSSSRSIRSLGGHGWDGHISIDTGGWHQQHHQHHHTHAIPIGQHIELIKPVAVPVVKNIGIPLVQPIGIPVPHITAIAAPQPYPVHVPVAHPVAIPIIKTIATIVEKRIPYPIEKIIPIPIEKHVPIHIEKYIPVPVEKPYPVHVPVHKHVFHRSKSHGWDDRR